MYRNSASRVGIFDPRALLALSLGLLGSFLAVLSFAGTPSDTPKESKSNSRFTARNVRALRIKGVLRANTPQILSPTTDWAIVTSANTNLLQSNYLSSVFCNWASDCWAVGDYTSGN